MHRNIFADKMPCKPQIICYNCNVEVKVRKTNEKNEQNKNIVIIFTFRNFVCIKIVRFDDESNQT